MANGEHLVSHYPQTVVDHVRHRASKEPERPVYRFLVDGDGEGATLTYGQLDVGARGVASVLQSAGMSDERVLLLCPPGLEYVSAFLGCLYARAVAVPVPGHGINRATDRLETIVEDSRPKAVLTTRAVLARADALCERVPALKTLEWFAADAIDTRDASAWREPSLSSNTLAFLQYTSGSTREPRGVMVTHGNLSHNERLIRESFGQNRDSVILSWLPLHHDMGLIGGVLQPLYVGATCILMSPFSFLQRPAGWLRAISRYKVTTSGGPNFAYDLCVRKMTGEDCASLDLSSWTVAFNGSEPIRSETMQRFAERFEPYGFSSGAFFPCYGLAEATLLVSGGKTKPQPLVKAVLAEAMKRNLIVWADDLPQESRLLAASGRVPPEQHVVIVEPESAMPCPAGRLGEIWVRGPSVSAGYYGRPAESAQTFEARIAGTGEGPFLRTGDLGFISEGELFVTGRLKDLIIMRGQNYYPHDIEFTAERSSSFLRSGCGAAFSVDVEGRERLVFVQEMELRGAPDLGAVIDLIRASIAEDHGLRAYAIVLIKAGAIPRTSSGKVRRQMCRAKFLENGFEALARWTDSEADPSLEFNIADEAPGNPGAWELWLISWLAKRFDLPEPEIDPEQSIYRYGLDSLEVMQLVHSLEAASGHSISTPAFLDAASIREIARLMSAAPTRASRVSRSRQSSPPAEFQLSRGQQALYFIHQLVQDLPLHNISALAAIDEPLDADLLRESFQILLDRHASLRACFVSTPNGPVQRIRERGQLHFRQVDATSLSDDELNEGIAAESNRTLDLERDALFRVTLYRKSGETLLLLVVHHIVIDFWSLSLLFRELGILYSGRNEASLPPLDYAFSDYVESQEEILASAEGERLWQYWKQKLSGELPVLDLFTDRPRPAVQSYRCACERIKLSADAAGGLYRLNRTCGSTLFMSLAAAFEALLHRYSGRDDILLGALTNGRRDARFADVVGYFINPIVLRGVFSDGPSFQSFLLRMKATAIEARQHQEYPFPLLVEQLDLARDASRPPLVQAMLFYQKAHLPGQDALTSLAVGAPCEAVEGGLRLEFLPVSPAATQFDLTLRMAETDTGIVGALEYNADIFDSPTIVRMLRHFDNLISQATLNSTRPISDLSLLGEAERCQLIFEWNDTHLANPTDQCVHSLFENQARRTPDALAIVFDEDQITYRALSVRVKEIATILVEMGAGPEVLVGVCTERSPAMVAALLAILKSGAAYLPLDPSLPRARLSIILADSNMRLILTQARMIASVLPDMAGIPCVDIDRIITGREDLPDLPEIDRPENLAYVIYTSGSTGKPKGVMVSHRNVVNFLHSMDELLEGDPEHWLAVTRLSFDISVVELLWTLSRGFRLIIHGDLHDTPPAASRREIKPREPMEFSLFYFASDDREVAEDRYRLLLEGAKFADRHGFSAVWTPERHFHPFGGLYPNPSVTGAAIAAVTERVQIRAGSVVLPLHNPIRVAEEWSVIDNISKGRVGISIASGWHADDFILAPGKYASRKQAMLEGIDIVRKLWRGERVSFDGGAGNKVEARIFPRPVQPDLPIWVTAAGSLETFKTAGRIGANLLTHLLGQELDELADKIAIYRKEWQDLGHGPGGGRVTLMAHTFIGDEIGEVRSIVRGPFCDYLKSSYGLIENLIRSLGENIDFGALTEDDLDALMERAFERYFQTSGLMGTVATCSEMVERMRAAGVDEIACLIDFGIDTDLVIESLSRLEELKNRINETERPAADKYSISAQILRHGITHLQCTPSMARMMAAEPDFRNSLASLHTVLLGGEALPEGLVRELREPGGITRMFNMYGPTETTIWSTAAAVRDEDERITIGRALGNTESYSLDSRFEPVPVGIAGSLYIGGDGVARGYLNSSELTAERFLPDFFSGKAGARIYATGDLSSHLQDGRTIFLGRTDQQIKLRGQRVELGEIEAALDRCPGVLQAAVLLQKDSPAGDRLVAYVASLPQAAPTEFEMREFLRERVPPHMVPAAFVNLLSLPLTPNGKVDRKALPAASPSVSRRPGPLEAPRTPLEEVLTNLWAEVLGLEAVGIHDNFFEIGGHSILASKLVSRVREVLQIELPLRTLFTAPSVAVLAETLAADPQISARIHRIATLFTSVASFSDDEAEALLNEGGSYLAGE